MKINKNKCQLTISICFRQFDTIYLEIHVNPIYPGETCHMLLTTAKELAIALVYSAFIIWME